MVPNFELPLVQIYDILKKITYDLDFFIYKISSSYYKLITYFNQWKSVVLKKKILHELKQISSSIASFNKTNLLKYV